MTYYDQTIADCDRQLSIRRARNKAFIISEVLTFLLAIGAIILYTTSVGNIWMIIAAIFFFCFYLYIRYTDTRNDRAIRNYEDIRSACLKERNFMNGKLDDFDDGQRYADPKHPFTTDLDVFGTGSLYQRVCRAVTSGGADALAHAFELANGPHDERSKAIAELSKQPDLLTEFKRWGQRGVADTEKVRAAFGKIHAITLPWWARNKAVWVFSIVYTALFLVALVVSIITQKHLLGVVWWAVFNFFAIYLICNGSLRKISDAVGGLIKQLATYVRLVAIIENTDVDDKVLKTLRQRVDGASGSLREMDDILQKLESRGNILGLVFFDMLFLWDYRILYSFDKWQKKYANRFDEWIDTVSEYDMLISMATFRYNENGLTTDAEIIDSPKVVYEASGLFHPFLGRKAVRNDFSIDDRNFYIITGANMAGKSTFLRSLGINYVLAMNGMPVFAEKFTVSRFNLFTSMRTTDDLTHGISYFNAELLRLKQILDSITPPTVYQGNQAPLLSKEGRGGSSNPLLLKEGRGGSPDGSSPTLIILDEILKGTNSEDKLSGSRMFLEYVSKKNVTGVIATHDLKLSAMADEQPDRFHNFCFEIALGTDVTYSYKITPGVARNQNATFLLKRLLND